MRGFLLRLLKANDHHLTQYLRLELTVPTLMEMNVAIKARVPQYFIILDGYMLCFKKKDPRM